MCNAMCLDFVYRVLTPELVRGKRILDCGAVDVNGSAKYELVKHGLAEYIGIDIAGDTRTVDKVMSVYDLVKEFGVESFDIVLTTEMLEHVEDWRTAITQMKRVCKVGGYICITTRSKGFGLHNYPADHWRYEEADMREIFKDFEILKIERDNEPGVLVFVRKPEGYVEQSLEHIELYNIAQEKAS